MSVIRRHLPLFAAALSLALPSAAHAGSVVFGSDLASPANAVESHSADTVYWNSTVATERPGPPGEPRPPTDPARHQAVAASPATGQLRYVTIRGGMLPGAGLGDFRFVVLRPDASGAVRVAAIDPIPRRLATTTDPLHRTPSKGFNWKLCLRKGDHLGIWKLGHGDARIFADVPGSVLSWYENAAGIAAGNVFTGTPSSGRELLMQVRVNTGRDAFSRCPGGYKDHVYRNLDISGGRLSGGSVVVRGRCPRETYGGCFGRLTLRASGMSFGSTPFEAPSGRRVNVRVPVSAAHAALLRRRGSLRGDVEMKGHDDPTDPRNTAAPRPRPGRQTSTNVVRRVVLRAG
jgi:hypothetical protein